ncbi:MAG: sterol desaturase family protein [Pseudomonadales bacterium]
MYYDWQAGLAFFVILVTTTILGKYLVFKVPALQEMREINRKDFKLKRAKEKYPPVMKASNKVGMYTNLTFFVCVAPFLVTLQAQPAWKILLHTVAILMVYDFFYYLTHRFVFHGQGYFRHIHAVHHQARKPSHIDAFYVHPLETFVGIILFLATMVIMAVLLGPLHCITGVLTFLVFTQLNTINHCYVNLPYTPFKTLSWITAKHAVHHENMHMGNYATITLLYDKLFGTFD